MGASALKISLLPPETYRIDLSEQFTHVIGVAPPVPYGTARLTIDTTAHWAERTDYVAQKGEIIVYSDRRVMNGVPYPALKIGDGRAYAVDLPFVNDDSNEILLDLISAHINDTELHVVPGEREKWNSKVSCSIEGERLIFEGTD